MSTSLPTPGVPIPEETKELFVSVNAFVHDYMSLPGYDNSHDYHHILRVVSHANRILQSETQADPTLNYDTSAIFLAALLHDVGDHKYAEPDEDAGHKIFNILRERGASRELAVKVQSIVKHVGYTNEVKDPASVVETLSQYPELAIVQDADRLDAIGALGVARCFAFGGAKRKGIPMAAAIDHFEEKLYKLPDMMKTATGQEMAVVRKQRLLDFASQFEEEARLSFVLEDQILPKPQME